MSYQDFLGILFYIVGIAAIIGAGMRSAPVTDGLLLLVVGTLWFATASAEGK